MIRDPAHPAAAAGRAQTLMQTKSFDEISVQDITEAATVNRATFYDHYTDKFALLEAMVAGGFHRLLHERNVTFDGTCQRGVGASFWPPATILTLAHTGGDCDGKALSAADRCCDDGAVQRILMQGMPVRFRFGAADGGDCRLRQLGDLGAVKQWFLFPTARRRKRSLRRCWS